MPNTPTVSSIQVNNGTYEIRDEEAQRNISNINNTINNLATVAISGNYNDLNNKPDLMTEYWVDHLKIKQIGDPYQGKNNETWVDIIVTLFNVPPIWYPAENLNSWDSRPYIKGQATHIQSNINQISDVCYLEGTSNNTQLKTCYIPFLQSDVEENNFAINDFIKIQYEKDHVVWGEDLAKVATSGDYNDLNNKPDWTYTTYTETVPITEIVTNAESYPFSYAVVYLSKAPWWGNQDGQIVNKDSSAEFYLSVFDDPISSTDWFFAYEGHYYWAKIPFDSEDISSLNVGDNLNVTYTIENEVIRQDDLVYWKEPGFGDKFAIKPYFDGVDDSNLLQFQGAVGEENTNPQLSNLMTLSGKSGNLWVKGNLEINGIFKQNENYLVTSNSTTCRVETDELTTGDTKRGLIVKGTVNNSNSIINNHTIGFYIGAENAWVYDRTSATTLWRCSVEGHRHTDLETAIGGALNSIESLSVNLSNHNHDGRYLKLNSDGWVPGMDISGGPARFYKINNNDTYAARFIFDNPPNRESSTFALVRGHVGGDNDDMSLHLGSETPHGSNYLYLFSPGVANASPRVVIQGTGVLAAWKQTLGITSSSSDARLKTDLVPLTQDAVDFVKQLKPYAYTINNKRQVGLIAQDVKEIDNWNTDMAFQTEDQMGLEEWEKMPDGSETWILNYNRLIAPLTAALQDSMRRIDELEEKIAQLKLEKESE